MSSDSTIRYRYCFENRFLIDANCVQVLYNYSGIVNFLLFCKNT